MTKRSGFRAFVFLFLTLAISCCQTRAEEDSRREWHYQTPNGLRRLVFQGDGVWLHYFANGGTAKFEEVERTNEYIAIRNPENNNVQRLFADRGMMQLKGKGNFGKFADGKWVESTDQPATDDYRLRLVYFVPADRQPVNDYEARIRSVMTLVTGMFTDALKAQGQAVAGPEFETNADGQFVVHLVRGEKNARSYSGLPQEKSPDHARLVAEAVEQELGSTKDYAAVIFMETYELGPATNLFPGVMNVTVARPPRGGHAVVSAWILQDEFCSTDPQRLRQMFFDETPIQGRRSYGDQRPNSPRSELMEEGYGAALHELGHLFGLLHHRTAPTNIMGGGFRDIRWNVGLRRNSRQQAGFSRENAWFLMTSRFLNPEVDRSDSVRPSATMNVSFQVRTAVATIDAEDDRGLAFACLVDVSANDGLLMIAARQLTGKKQKVEFRLSASDFKSRESQLLLIVVDTGGNHKQVKQNIFSAQ
ncbi:hypothetical protein GC176_09910 [bacterium]|nr:hypothetical protein [bacterium]